MMDISGNQLEELDNSMRRLNKLETLKAGNNLIDDLPSPFVFLRALKEVDISDNKFTQVEARGHMPRTIRHFKLNGNEIKRGESSRRRRRMW